MPFPLVKLGYLLVRTVAKPVVNTFKKQARDHPWFKGACGRIAQAYHRSEVRMKRRIANGQASNTAGSILGQSVESHIKPLDEQKAVELGAEFLGEALIFGIAGTLLLLEAARNNRQEAARRAAIEERFNELYRRLEVLEQTGAKPV